MSRPPRRMSLTKLFATNGSAKSNPLDGGARTGSQGGADEESKTCAIRVVVRARPLSERELLAKVPVIVNVTRSSVQVVNPIVFLDPMYHEALSPTTRRGGGNSSSGPTTLNSQAVAAAVSMGECRTFNFDRCFGMDNPILNELEIPTNAYDVDFETQKPNQELVFEEVGKDMISSAFQGFNCTVLAYGQTGSGKTHTMVGEKTSAKGKGLIPRVCEALFKQIDARRASSSQVDSSESMSSISSDDGEKEDKSSTIFSVHISYCEIYKEKVNDLLDAAPPPRPSTPKSRASFSFSTNGVSTSAAEEQMTVHSPTTRKALRVREHPVTGPFVEGLSSRSVASYAEIEEEMIAGDKLRTVAATLMNAVSSRSHAVFTIIFTQTTFDEATQSTHDKTSKICMIDLAGSERADVSGTSGDRLKEGAMINKSLSTLGRVISALSKQSSDRVPYRDSTLTWLLKESLGGNAKVRRAPSHLTVLVVPTDQPIRLLLQTTMIAMISPASDNYEETMSTLRYAESAKKVMNRAVVNEDNNARIIRQLRQEIEDLRTQLMTAKSSSEHYSSSDEVTPSLSEREDFYLQLQKEVEHFRSQQQQKQQEQPDEDDAEASTVQSDTVVRLHSVLPSLVNIDAGRTRGNDTVAFVLTEGETIFGSQPAIATRAAIADSERVSRTESTSSTSQDDNRPWSPTSLLKRLPFFEKSETDTAMDDGVDASNSDGGKLNTTASPESSSRHDIPADCKLIEVPASDVAPRHACFLCSEVKVAVAATSASVHEELQSISIDPPTEAATIQDMLVATVTAEDQDLRTELVPTIKTLSFEVEVQPLDEKAVLKVNGEVVSVGDKRRLENGDEVELGHSLRLRLHVPGSSAQVTPLLGTTGNSILEDEETTRNAATDHDEKLQHYIEEANTICKKWHLPTEFEICRINKDSTKLQSTTSHERQNVIAVRKKLGDRRYSVENWDAADFERQLRFLRDIAGSLESSNSPTTTNTPGKASAKRLPANTMPMSLPRSHMTATACGGTFPPSTPKSRLLGFGWIYLDDADTNVTTSNKTTGNSDDVLKAVAILSNTGVTVGLLQAYISYNEIQPPKNRRASQTFAWQSPRASVASRSSSTHSVRIRVSKLRLSDPCTTVASGVWVVLKQGTNDANCNVLTAKRVDPAGEDGGHWLMTFDIACAVSLPTIDTVAVEIWYRHWLPDSLPLQVADATARPLEVYFSVDIDERDNDGIYRPVPIKPDGSLRLTCGRRRRVRVRVTQSDLLPFGLSRVLHASLSPAIAIREVDAVAKSKSLDVNYTSKPLLLRAISRHSAVSLLCRVNNDQPRTNSAEARDKGVQTIDDDTAWRSLEIRDDSIVDPASRSITAVMQWDHPSEQQRESPDSNGVRTIYRIAIAFSSCRSINPIVISKPIVTKMSPSMTSTAKRLTRDREATQTVWWARESCSRQFRLGTWCSADSSSDSEEGASTVQVLVSTSDVMSIGDAAGEMYTGTHHEFVSSAVKKHILGMHRVELGIELERVRQRLWIAFRGVQQVEAASSSCHMDNTDSITDPRLTVERANQHLGTVNSASTDESLHVECVARRDFEHGAGLFLRFKRQPGLVMSIADGRLIEEDADREDTACNISGDGGAASTMHCTHAPTKLAVRDDFDDNSDMSGFLMLSVSLSPEDAAAALVTPLPLRGQPHRRYSIPSIASSKDASMNWQRQWFVLRRPFLYVYDNYERKTLTGVMDISTCQLASTPTLLSQAVKVPSLVESVLGSSISSSSCSDGQSWAAVEPAPLVVKTLPFAFRLVSMTGAISNSDNKKKCVVWTLQASTTAELHSWLAVIQPFKMEERAAGQLAGSAPSTAASVAELSEA